MILPNYFCLLDTEYTSWENSLKNNWARPGEKKEIIQIAVFKIRKLNKKLKIIDKINIYIKPKFNPILSEYIIKLTGITNKIINNLGIDFDTAMLKLYNFCKYNNNLINVYSYGGDYIIIKENLLYHNYLKTHFLYDWGKNHYNLVPLLKNENIPTEKYTSGTLYKHFFSNLISDVHNAEWDVKSLYLSLNKLINK